MAVAPDMAMLQQDYEDETRCHHELKNQLLRKVGQFVPLEVDLVPPDEWTYHIGDMEVTSIRPNDSESITEVKNFLRSNFYASAPMARALGLHDQTRASTRAMVDKELDFFVGTGASLQIRRSVQGRKVLLGAELCTVWSRDDNYEVINCSALDWYNTAAEIAEELQPEDPTLLWRESYYQHIYNVAQKTMQDRHVPLAYFAAMGHYDPSIRKLGITTNQFSTYAPVLLGHDVVHIQNTNFTTMERLFRRVLYDEVDCVAYGDVTLTRDDQRVFDCIKDSCHRTKFFAAKWPRSENVSKL